jgi:hypothetical protein
MMLRWPSGADAVYFTPLGWVDSEHLAAPDSASTWRRPWAATAPSAAGRRRDPGRHRQVCDPKVAAHDSRGCPTAMKITRRAASAASP